MEPFAVPDRDALGWYGAKGAPVYVSGASPKPESERYPMTSSAFPREAAHLERKDVHIRLKGGDSIEGTIHIPEGLSLLHFLGTKKYFLNLTSVRQSGHPQDQEPIEHLSLRLSNVVWIIPQDGTLHVSTATIPTDSSRPVELQLVDGLKLTVSLNISDEQRMSDYLDANWAFLPLWSAEVPGTSDVIERLAVNHEAILAIRELPRS